MTQKGENVEQEMTQWDMALETLKAKHNNGNLENIHKQVFFKLNQDKCPVCDVPARMWLQKREILLDVNSTMMQLTSVDKLSNAHGKTYDPKSAPAPTELTCKCGRTEKVSDSQVNGPEYCRIETADFECPQCFLKRQGL